MALQLRKWAWWGEGVFEGVDEKHGKEHSVTGIQSPVMFHHPVYRRLVDTVAPLPAAGDIDTIRDKKLAANWSLSRLLQSMVTFKDLLSKSVLKVPSVSRLCQRALRYITLHQLHNHCTGASEDAVDAGNGAVFGY